MALSASNSKTREFIPLELHEDAVFGANHCQSVNAQKLCLVDIDYRLENNEKYDIGGTYTGDEPDLWFYYTTHCYLPNNYILSIFVNHRKSGSFSIGISDISSSGMKFVHKIKPGKHNTDSLQYTFLPKLMTWKMFISPRNNLSHHIITYSFNKTHLELLKNFILCIPIAIEINPKGLQKAATLSIRKKHEQFINCTVKQTKPDFVLRSATDKEYSIHRIFLLAHSLYFRDMVKKTENMTDAFIDINDTLMGYLIEFLYTGMVQDIDKDLVLGLKEIAVNLKIDRLLHIVSKVLCATVTVENAIDLAVLSENHNLQQLQATVFQFISENSDEVMKTDGWNNLNDATLAKKMLKVFYSSN